MFYAFTCTIQARGRYKTQSHVFHVTIMSSLGDYMPHNLYVIDISYWVSHCCHCYSYFVFVTCNMKYNKVKYSKVKPKLLKGCIKCVGLKRAVWVFEHKIKSINQKLFTLTAKEVASKSPLK